jgi:rhodanese-related sulfurtransferase
MNSNMLKFSVWWMVVFTRCAVTLLAADPTPEAGKAAITHVDAAAAGKLVANKKVVVLDVRTPQEYKAGHIAGATNIDFLAATFEGRIANLDTNQAYLVHCASGGRSTRCLPVLQKHGFKLIYHLDGGIKAWEKAGLAVETVEKSKLQPPNSRE